MTNFGDKLASLRKSKNLTQKQLGAMLNVSAQAISKWEQNSSSPDFDTLCKIADIFNISLDEFKSASNKSNNAIGTPATLVKEKQPFSFSAFLYKYKAWFISGLALIVLALFSFNFISICFANIEFFHFNGFKMIFSLFKGSDYLSYLYGINANYTENITTYTSLACLAYAVSLILIATIVINNITHFFKKHENINNQNLTNSTLLLICSLIIIACFFNIKKGIVDSSELASASSVAIWFIVALTSIIFGLTIYFKKCKLNDESIINESIKFRKQFPISIAILCLVSIVSYFLNTCSFNIDGGVHFSFLSYAPTKIFTTVVLILTLIYVTICSLLYCFKKLKTLSVFSLLGAIQLLILNLVLILHNKNFDLISFTSETAPFLEYSPIAYIPTIFMALLVFITLKHSILTNKILQANEVVSNDHYLKKSISLSISIILCIISIIIPTISFQLNSPVKITEQWQQDVANEHQQRRNVPSYIALYGSENSIANDVYNLIETINNGVSDTNELVPYLSGSTSGLDYVCVYDGTPELKEIPTTQYLEHLNSLGRIVFNKFETISSYQTRESAIGSTWTHWVGYVHVTIDGESYKMHYGYSYPIFIKA